MDYQTAATIFDKFAALEPGVYRVHTPFANPLKDGRARYGFESYHTIAAGTRFTLSKTERALAIDLTALPTIVDYKVEIGGRALVSGGRHMFLPDKGERATGATKKVLNFLSFLVERGTKVEEDLGSVLSTSEFFGPGYSKTLLLALLLESGKISLEDVKIAADAFSELSTEEVTSLEKKHGI